MPPTETPQFHNFSGPMESVVKKGRKGFFVSRLVCLLLVVGIVVTVIVVSLLVHFLSPSAPPPSVEPLWQQCLKLAADKNRSLCGSEPEATAATPTRKPLPNDVRLPLNVHPQHYDVHLRPDIYGDDPAQFNFSGSVHIYVTCTRPTETITLHTKKLDILTASIEMQMDSGAAEEQSPKSVSWREDMLREFLVLRFDQPLKPGFRYQLTIDFNGRLKRNLVGIYLSSYKQDNVTKWLVASQMQSTYARRVFPCFDEPAIKATFNMTLERKKHVQSLSNMPIIRTEIRFGLTMHNTGMFNFREDNWVADYYDTTKKMSTYLLAIVICEFDYRETKTSDGKITFRVWARPDAIEQVNYALQTGVKIIEFFESYFDIPFPLPKQDMIAVPDFDAGAMENWGLILYRETALLFENGVSSETNKERVAVVVSHELAHQWFGNLVTLAWWDDLWLNEGFASYMEYVGVNHVHPDWKMMEQFVVIDLIDVLKIDSLSSSHPIYVPVGHPEEINQIFDSISYGKGASVIRMMYNYLGEETFKKGLSNYLKKHQYGTTTHKDLWDALNQQAKADNKTANVAEIMDTWILQMGYPVVTVSRNLDDGTALVTQSRFLLDPQQKPSTKYTSPFGYKWMVPFTYILSSAPTWNAPPAVFMNMTDVVLSDLPNADWIIGNIGHSGVYRVNYDSDNWKKLINQLNINYTVIPEKNRAQIIDDAFNLGRSGFLDQLVALNTTAYLKDEKELTPWRTAIRNLGYIELMLARTATRGLYEKYILQLIEPMYRTMQWDEPTNSSHLQIYLRMMMLRVACTHGERDCVNNATALFHRWMDNPSDNRIPADLKQTVYCTALRHGGLAEWNFAYEQYNIANVAVEKYKLLRSLSCSNKPWVLSSLLLRTLNKNEIRRQDIASVIASVSRNDIGRYIVWDFVRANWDAIKGTLEGIFGIRRLTGFIAQGFNTQYELEELDEFGAKHPEVGVHSRVFKQRREETLANIRWMTDNQRKIHDWLEKNIQ